MVCNHWLNCKIALPQPSLPLHAVCMCFTTMPLASTAADHPSAVDSSPVPLHQVHFCWPLPSQQSQSAGFLFCRWLTVCHVTVRLRCCCVHRAEPTANLPVALPCQFEPFGGVLQFVWVCIPLKLPQKLVAVGVVAARPLRCLDWKY